MQNIKDKIEKLIKDINELGEIHEKIVDQAEIAREISKRTDNVDNLRFIIKDLVDSIGLWNKKDLYLFNDLKMLLEAMKEIPCEW